MRRQWPITAALLALLAAQIAVSEKVKATAPRAYLLPEPPTAVSAAVQSLGDPEFLFRVNALRVQHAGNLDGRLIPFKDLDYGKLGAWFETLDRLDPAADVVPTMAAYLFSGTQRPEDTRHLVDYLEQHGKRDVGKKWRWLAQAVYIARYKLKDLGRAREVAKILAEAPDPEIMDWARSLQIFVLLDLGEKEAARAILQQMLLDPRLPESERRWTKYYLERHLSDAGPAGGGDAAAVTR
jgi:hypothetical protein